MDTHYLPERIRVAYLIMSSGDIGVAVLMSWLLARLVCRYDRGSLIVRPFYVKSRKSSPKSLVLSMTSGRPLQHVDAIMG